MSRFAYQTIALYLNLTYFIYSPSPDQVDDWYEEVLSMQHDSGKTKYRGRANDNYYSQTIKVFRWPEHGKNLENYSHLGSLKDPLKIL